MGVYEDHVALAVYVDVFGHFPSLSDFFAVLGVLISKQRRQCSHFTEDSAEQTRIQILLQKIWMAAF
jgi:hypothetical protein